ncbi:hypothetical protein [Tenggerimyces flavus]|uniref:Uncharacterized protein n=1 Tax=Tenggerimyces flavus TaxID=1708749 RepID=A0ABV7YMG3_9ACTN|nr:hypothetical protein [Tenggerimyces flavus]MBM7789596.1 hypothetical protein [Tenggerimyces flavus]
MEHTVTQNLPDTIQQTALRLTERLFSTPPTATTGNRRVEVHSLVSHEHLPLYLFAMKSLAYYWHDFSAVVHDDGTITDADRAILRQHVLGVDVVTRAAADAMMADLLTDYPLISSVRRRNVRILQLTDYFMLSDADMVIGMDSDILFFDTPTEVAQWTKDPGEVALLYSPEEGWEPQGVHWIPDAFPDAPYVPYMCCGFACTDRGRFFDADFLEHLMRKTPPTVLGAPRYVTQMFYSLLGGRLGKAAHSLGEPYRSGPWEWLPRAERRVLCHYFASHNGGKTSENLCRDPGLFAAVLDRIDDGGSSRPQIGL